TGHPPDALFAVDPERLTASLVAEGTGAATSSPDGTMLALVGMRLARTNEGGFGWHLDRRFRSTLKLLDLRQGHRRMVEPCIGCQVERFTLSWSPSGERLVFFARQPGDRYRLIPYLWTRGSDEARALDAGNLPFTWEDWYSNPRIRIAWLGEQPVVQAVA